MKGMHPRFGWYGRTLTAPAWVGVIIGAVVPLVLALTAHNSALSDIVHRFPFFAFYPAIVVAAHLGGFPAGMTASVSSALVIYAVFLDQSFVVPTETEQSIALMVFVLTGALLARFQAHQRTQVVTQFRENQHKDEFLAILSHELRTPLNVVLGYARMLKHSTQGQREERLASIIERNAVLQLRLVEDILDVQRIVTGQFNVDPEPTSIAELTRTVTESQRGSVDTKRIQCLVTVPETTLLVDPARMQQAIWNLLNNAIKFTPEDGCIGIRGEVLRDGRFALQVQDSGEGIPREFLPHVFERFRQLDSSTTRRHFGLGLGLAIVKAVVEQHGGTVSAESAGVGHGATFTLVLPHAAVLPREPVPDAAAETPTTLPRSISTRMHR